MSAATSRNATRSSWAWRFSPRDRRFPLSGPPGPPRLGDDPGAGVRDRAPDVPRLEVDERTERLCRVGGLGHHEVVPGLVHVLEQPAHVVGGEVDPERPGGVHVPDREREVRHAREHHALVGHRVGDVDVLAVDDELDSLLGTSSWPPAPAAMGGWRRPAASGGSPRCKGCLSHGDEHPGGGVQSPVSHPVGQWQSLANSPRPRCRPRAAARAAAPCPRQWACPTDRYSAPAPAVQWSISVVWVRMASHGRNAR